MNLTLHFNAVIIGGACCIPFGFVLGWLGLTAGWGREWGAWLAWLGASLAGCGIVAVLIGVGMALKA